MERNIYYSFLKTDDELVIKIDVSEIFCRFIRQDFKIELIDEFDRILCIYDYILKEEILGEESRFWLEFHFYENFFCDLDIKMLNFVQFDKKDDRKVYYSFPISLYKEGGESYGKNCFRSCEVCQSAVG